MKYNKFNGILTRNFGKQMRKNIQIRFHNVIPNRLFFMAVSAGCYVKKIDIELKAHKCNSYSL
jgi:hypothetical protein